mmetsp:Transcript_3528/g.6394  ORF Transcript_3528/g.6394 Transcript_3528/m.6394 type:complete len:289 (-) Transcript_3528:1039-1905(-)
MTLGVSNLMVKFLEVKLGGSLGHLHGIRTRRLDRGISEEWCLSIISVSTLGLEGPADCLLDLHDDEHNHHGSNNKTPHETVHTIHAEDKGVQSRDVSEDELKHSHNSNGAKSSGVAHESTRVHRAVVCKPGAQHDRHGSEIKNVEGDGSHPVLDIFVTQIGISAARGDNDSRPNNASSQEACSNNNTKEEETSNETLSNLTGRDGHDTIFGGLNGSDKPKGHSTDKVGVQNLDGTNGRIGQLHKQTKQHGETLGVVDRGVDKEDLTQVIPHDTALFHGVHNGGKVIIS